MSQTTELIALANTENQDRTADIIFVHGLGGDALETWHHPNNKKDKDNFWGIWLGKDLPQMGIWSLAYEVEPKAWKGSTMPLVERADNILDLLEVKKIGERPIFFITHSMGGLLVKQILRNANDSGNNTWEQILNNTQGIVYLATPHAGSMIASFLKFIRANVLTSVSVEELEAHDPRLLELNRVHRNNEIFNRIPIKVYGENKPIKPIGIIVNKTSVDPGRKGVTPIIIDRDHISICKPESNKDRLYLGVKQFIEANIHNNNQSSNSDSRETQGNNDDSLSQSTSPKSTTILILAASPTNQARLRLEKEVREIDEGLQRSKRRDKFTLKQRWAVRPQDFRRALLDLTPQIVHFCGHGEGEDGLVLENDEGKAQLVSTQALTNLFKRFAARGLKCVVLNSCYSEVQANAIAEHIDFVVGMNRMIGDNAAIQFAVGFYDELGAGYSYEDAYRGGCDAIALEEIPEEHTPKLKKKPN